MTNQQNKGDTYEEETHLSTALRSARAWPSPDRDRAVNSRAVSAARILPAPALRPLHRKTEADQQPHGCEYADRYTHLENKAAYEDDFDMHEYDPTPEENCELFNSVEMVQVMAGYDTSCALRSDGT